MVVIFRIKKIIVFMLASFMFLSGLYLAALAYSGYDADYYSLSQPQLIIGIGPAGSFDHSMTHTLSVVELNKNAFRFWGYYTGRDENRVNTDIGLAYSNDLIHWVKDESSPIIRDLRWGTVVMVDGIINMFGTRDYGADTRIVRLTSEDGKNFTEKETVVPSAAGEKHQNPFIFYDEKDGLYRLYYFHLSGNDNRIEEKHSASIDGLASARANLIMSNDEEILAAPSIFYRDENYWLTCETFRNVNGVGKWQTLAFISDNPIDGFDPVNSDRIIADHDACFFPYIFDNRLNGFYSHKHDNGTWELFRVTHDYSNKSRIELRSHGELKANSILQLTADHIQSDGTIMNVTSAATWATSDNSIATVQKGKITARKEGSVIITVSYGGASTAAHFYIRAN